METPPPATLLQSELTKSWSFSESHKKRLHVDVVPLHDATEVLVGGEDAVEAVVVDVSDNHLPRMFEKIFNV